MFEGPASTALVAGLFALHLAVVWLARRHRDGRAVDERPNRLADGRLRCPGCGAVNEPEFQFCRECVAKLQERAPPAPTQPASGGSLFR